MLSGLGNFLRAVLQIYKKRRYYKGFLNNEKKMQESIIKIKRFSRLQRH